MKTNNLILSGLLSGLCLFTMGSSCGGDVEEANTVHAQQASVVPKEELKEEPREDAKAQEESAAPNVSEEMTKEAPVEALAEEAIVPEESLSVQAPVVVMEAQAGIQFDSPDQSSEVPVVTTNVQENSDVVFASCCKTIKSKSVSVADLTCPKNSVMEWLKFNQDDKNKVTSSYKNNSMEELPSFSVGSSFIFVGSDSLKEITTNKCTVLPFVSPV